MDSIKKPEMILSLVSVIGVVSLGVYGQKRLTSISDEISEIKKACQAISIRASEPNRADSVRMDSLTSDLKILKAESDVHKKKFQQVTRNLADLTQNVEDVMDSFELLLKQLREKNIEIKISPPVEEEPIFGRRIKPKQAKPQQRQQRNYYDEPEPDSEDEITEQLSEARGRKRF